MKKIILFLLLSIILISACKKESPETEPCINITKLDKNFKLDPSQVPQGTWEEKSCPSGKKIIYIDLITTEDNSRWRKALYCEDEDYFWIADFRPPGISPSRLNWYGVYEGRPCE